MLQDIEKAKEEAVPTLSETVLSVGDLVDWEDKHHKYGSVPVTIR